MSRKRLPRALVDRRLVGTEVEAVELIAANRVLVNGAVALNPEHQVSQADQVVVEATDRFVSRGGHKLDFAFQSWPITVEGVVAVDLGSSTGGFTDCMLQRGARKVIAVDVGEHLLHERLTRDPRVEVMSGVNVRSTELLPSGVAKFVSVDLSFISVSAAIPAIIQVGEPGATVVVLLKPQFEATRAEADRFAGVVEDESIHRRVVDAAIEAFVRAGCRFEAQLPSPIRGAKGNVEYLLWFRTGDRVEAAD